MIEAVMQLYRRLDLAQRRNWFRIAATGIALAACALFFGPLLSKSYSLNQQRRALNTALFDQSINSGGEHAMTLQSSGEVHLNGRTYGGKDILEAQLPIFDEEGSLINVPVLTERLLEDQRPAWAPDWLLDQPRATWLLAIT